MFTKKFKTALLLTPLFVGCVVEDDGDTDANTDPGTSSVSASTDDTGVSSVSATEETGPATGDETADETGVGTTGGGGDGMFCLPSCMEAVDCCQPGTEAMGCPDTYPYAYECNEGICEFLGCSTDEDCMLVAGTTCHQVNGLGQCAAACTPETEKVDCLLEFGETCSGTDDDGMMICQFEVPPCEEDMDCGKTGLVCNTDTGTCECDGDDDCTDLGGTCNLETGACNCTDDASCGDGFSCVAF